MKCSIIGKGTLIIKATEILIEKGNEVVNIITNDRNILEWAQRNKINANTYQTYNNIVEVLEKREYDYLFSIVNDVFLKTDILNTAKQGAINFHDSPLPKYAGANATTWAILEKQAQHAVTWHKVGDGYDNGDILVQEFFEISENETVFSLNAKCFEFAIKTFTEMIEKLEKGIVEFKEQDLSKRTYISRKHNKDLKDEALWNVGYICDDMHSRDILALFRALDFKTYENPLAKVKIMLNGITYIVTKMSIEEDEKKKDISSEVVAGIVVKVDKNSIFVKSIDNELIRLDEIQDIYGNIVSTENFGEGSKVFIDRESAKEIRRIDKQYAHNELYWKNRLENIHYSESPFCIEVNKKGIIHKFQKKIGDTFEVILSKFLLYLSFLQGNNEISISIRYDLKNCKTKGAYSEYRPLNYVLKKGRLIDDINQIVFEYREKGTFVSDIFLRYEELKDIHLPQIRVSENPSLDYYKKLELENNEINLELLYFNNDEGVQLFLNFPDSLDYTNIIIEHFQKILLEDLENLSYEKLNLLINDKKRIDKWNATEEKYNCIDSYIAEFKKVAIEYPNNIAIEFEDKKLSYKELDDISNQIANYLLSIGVKKGQTIAILFKKNIYMIAAILGVLKIGAIYIPIDKKYPKDRIEYMINDAKVEYVISDNLDNCEIEYLVTNCTKIELEKEINTIKRCFKSELYDQKVNAEDIAYIIYTSGTTGRPKGVLVKHRGLNNLKIAQRKLFGFSDTDRILQYSSFSFDASIWEMSLALNVGATIVLCDSDVVHPGQELSVFLQKRNVTAISLPPSVINTLHYQWNYSALHTIISGSETCWMNLVKKWKDKVRFFNGYGPTESTVCVSFKEFIEDEEIVTIGTPITNTQIVILDDRMQSVPIGKAGEIVIGGAGIAEGYLNQEGLTRNKFVNLERDKSKFYRSGDLGRFTPSGDIEYLGRIDNQVKIRGFRIEIEEIEKVALESNLIEMSCCLLNEDIKDKKLILYYIRKDNSSIEQNLREFMKQKLPSYMIPSYFIAVDSFPTLPNGKLDKKGLLKIKPISSKRNIAPRNNTEEILSIIWSDLLKIKNIGVEEDYFEVGGDSLQALEVVVRLSEDYGIEIPVSAIFENSTIEKLAIYINKKDTEPFVPLIKLKTTGKKKPIFAIHPGDGNVFCYTDLVRALDENQPFYGLQAYGVEEGTVALTTIEEMASAYISEIKKVQPKGPYLLCGYCAGGTIAFEMAQQLLDEGETVEKLILIDARASHTYTPIDEVQNFINFARNFEGISNRDIFKLYANKHKINYSEKEIYNLLFNQDITTRLQNVWECAQELGVLPNGVGVTYLERLFNVWQGLGGMNSYYVKNYPGEILLYYAKDDKINQSLNVPYLGWEQANPNIRVKMIEGNHFTCIKSPLVETWAENFIE